MYRQVDTGTWDDPWFAELEPDGKLLFLYLLTNRRSTAAGVFEITIRAMSFETGLDTKRVNAALESISGRVQWWPEHQTVWIRNFLRHQAVSPKFYMSAWSEMREMPETVRDSVGSIYPILTRNEKPPDNKDDIEALLIPYPKGIETLPEPSRKTSTRPSSRLVEASSLEGGDEPPPTPTKPKAKRATQVPDDFALNDNLVAWGTDPKQGYTVEQMREQIPRFVDYYRAKGEPRKDWDASFRMWMRNARDYGHLTRGAITVHRGGKAANADPWDEYGRKMGYITDDDEPPTDVIDTSARRTS